jgi:hypothetical protein
MSDNLDNNLDNNNKIDNNLNRTLKMRFNNKKRYDKLCKYIIICPFCETKTNLFSIYCHIKTLMCQMIQDNLFEKNDLKLKKMKLMIQIKKLRYDILNDLDNTILLNLLE